ncbi:MAG: hypothetical protein AAGA10_16130 [Bacteroidota bacterium]
MSKLVQISSTILFLLSLCLTPQTYFAQCDSASFTIDAISSLGNDQYEMQLTFCAPAGHEAVYFYQNTGAFAFFLEGAKLLEYPDSIYSSVTQSTYYGYSLFTDTVLYFENHYPNYWGYSDAWWVCNDGNCGSPQSYCTTLFIQTQGLVESITLKGISGGGNPAAGCPMTVYTDCFYNSFEASIAGNPQITIGSADTCTSLTPNLQGGSGDYAYLWCTGETTPSITACPEETRTYHLLVTDLQRGCQAEATFEVTVNDIRCGRNNDKLQICYNNQTYCVKPRRANRLINKKGAILGPCSGNSLRLGPGNAGPFLELFEVETYQKEDILFVDILSDDKAWVELLLISVDGKRYEAPRPFLVKEFQENELKLPVAQLPTGIYVLTVYANNSWVHSGKVFIE